MHSHRQIRALTGIRGLAACWLAAYHLHIMARPVPEHPSLLWGFFAHGYLAVDLFFVLSGFVMALSYEFFLDLGWSLRNCAAFLVRRFARIYPLYFLLTCYIALSVPPNIAGMHWDSATIVQNFLLVQAWGLGDGSVLQIFSMNPPSWSISTEFAAYLLFPALSVLVLRGSLAIVLPLFAALLAMVCALPFLQPAGNMHFSFGLMDIVAMPSFLPVARCVGEFTLGLIAYRLRETAAVTKYFGNRRFGYALTAVFAALMCLPNTDMILVCLFPTIILMLAVGDNVVTKLFGSKVAFFFGEISYSIYLLHWQLTPIHDHYGSFPFYVSLISCSFLAYSCIEKPCRNLIKRLEERYIEARA